MGDDAAVPALVAREPPRSVQERETDQAVVRAVKYARDVSAPHRDGAAEVLPEPELPLSFTMPAGHGSFSIVLQSSAPGGNCQYGNIVIAYSV